MTYAEMTPEQRARERERSRIKAALYRKKYPERVAATKARMLANPEYAARQKENHRRWYDRQLAAIGKRRWSEEEKRENMQRVAASYLKRETPEQRSRRLAKALSPEARAKQKATMRAKGPGALFWSLLSPDGVPYKFKNLAAFVRNNPHLFTEEQLRPVNKFGRTRIEAAIAMLSPRRKHCVEHCCGWRWNVDGATPASLLSEISPRSAQTSESCLSRSPDSARR